MKTLDQDFAHFLAYQNWNDLPHDVIEKLLVAYEHGDSRGRRGLEDAERLEWLASNCVETADEYGTGSQLYFGTYATAPLRQAIDQARGKGEGNG